MKVYAGKIDLPEYKVGQSYYLILSEFHKLYFPKMSSFIFLLLVLVFLIIVIQFGVRMLSCPKLGILLFCVIKTGTC